MIRPQKTNTKVGLAQNGGGNFPNVYHLAVTSLLAVGKHRSDAVRWLPLM